MSDKELSHASDAELVEDITDDEALGEPVVTEPEAGKEVIRVTRHASDPNLEMVLAMVPKGSVSKGLVEIINL